MPFRPVHAMYGETSHRQSLIDSILSSEGESDDCACAGSQMPTNLAFALSP
jgi:hypothetical protein